MPKNMANMLLFLCMFFYIIVALLLCGCQAPEAEPLFSTTPKQALIETVLKTDWIITVSILGVALSVMAWMNGSKTAIGVMAGCGVAIWMQLTVVRYAHVIAWIGLVFAVGVMLWTVFIKNRALKEIVICVEKAKNSFKAPAADTDYLDLGHKTPGWKLERALVTQNKTTQNIVSKIKGKKPGKRV